MKFTKEHIIDEIIRTAQENGGKPLGMQRFEQETGIKKYDWFGKYWSKWGDALIEAEFEPNELNKAYDEKFLIKKLIELIDELNKFPSAGEIVLKTYRDKSFPSMRTFEDRLGNKNEKVIKVIKYCENHKGMTDVLKICLPLLEDEKVSDKENTEIETDFGFVYLMKSGKFYKIGRSNDADRRAYELRIQLPEELKLIHKIKTDDPIGIEEYWHKRFKDKRKNGEWFELTRQDVEIFKRRKFM
jgi:hypothetical protein